MRSPYRRWTAEEIALLHQHREQAGEGALRPNWSALALQLGRPRRSVWSKLHELGLTRRSQRRVWSPADDRRLATLLEQHLSCPQIGRRLGRSAETVRRRAQRLGLGDALGHREMLSAERVARILGVHGQRVVRWIQRGYLRGVTVRRGTKRRVHLVCWADLDAFVAEETHWHRVDPERITDVALREAALEQRRGRYFLTVAQAERAWGYAPRALSAAILHGRLRAVQDEGRGGSRAGRWLVRDDWRIDLEGPRVEEKPRHVFSMDDDALIRALWQQVPGTVIARRIGCSTSGLERRAQRLGLTQLGHGYWRKKREESGA